MKKFLTTFLCLAFTLFSGIMLVACGKSEENPPPPANPNYDITQSDITMTVAVDSENVNISLSSDSQKVGSDKVTVVGMKAYEYFVSDPYKGLSESQVVSGGGNLSAEYTLGTTQTISFERYTEDEYDNLYNKYYVVSGDKILKGPVYATEIEAKVDAEPEIHVKSKKGILGEGVEYYQDLGASSVTLNFDISKAIYPNEEFDDGEKVSLPHPNTDVISFISNGKLFHFRKSWIEAFEENVNQYYKLGADVSVIIFPYKTSVRTDFPEKLTYYPWSSTNCDRTVKIMGLNTSNSYGFDYYIAFMELLAARETANNFAKGFATTFIIGNEIDYPQEYNRISQYQADFDVYMEEYSRLLRLTNLALKKYHSTYKVAFSVTNAFANPGEPASLYSENGVRPYITKNIVDWMNAKSKQEGDYDWGIAPHNYGALHSAPNVYEYDTSTGRTWGFTADFTTDSISLSNIELWDKYVNQDIMKFNGEARSLYMTETGVCALNEEEEKYQAATLAAAWYKVSQIDSIKVFNYFHVVDRKEEGNARHGLVYGDEENKPTKKKLAYDVWKYIDTQYSARFADPYLQYIKFTDANGEIHSVENGKITSYLDTLDVFGTGWFDGKTFDWSKATPDAARVETVYEWEDEADLSELKVYSGTYMYDGTEKTLPAPKLPAHITAKYSVDGGEMTTSLPSRRDLGTSNILISFFDENEKLVGRRQTTLTIGRMELNKSVYNLDEKIFLNITNDDAGEEGFVLRNDAWIGLYKADEKPGYDVSTTFMYVNQSATTCRRTYVLQEGVDFSEDADGFKELPAGDYVVYLINNGTPDPYTRYDTYILETAQFTILPEGQTSGLVDLSDVDFGDKTTAIDGSGQIYRYEIDAESLPQGVHVELSNNEQTRVGKYEVCATFLDEQDNVLERRYAVWTLKPETNMWLDKTSYDYTDSIYVTAFAPEESNTAILTSSEDVSAHNNTCWWVGVYRQDAQTVSNGGILFYYVKDDVNHQSGETYDITKEINGQALAAGGDFKAVLFRDSHQGTDGAYDNIDCVVNFHVEGPQVVVDYGVSTDKTAYAVGENITVTATVPLNAPACSWVALYLQEDVRNLQYYVNPIYWFYVTDASGHSSGTPCILQQQQTYANREYFRQGGLIAGAYELRLFSSSGDETKEASCRFTVGDPEDYVKDCITVDHENLTYKVGQPIRIKAISLRESEGAWLAVYHAGEVNENNYIRGEYKSLAYLGTGLHSTSYEEEWLFDTSDFEPGDYEIRLYRYPAAVEGTYHLDYSLTIHFEAA